MRAKLTRVRYEEMVKAETENANVGDVIGKDIGKLPGIQVDPFRVLRAVSQVKIFACNERN